jgi:hypothetical protein
MNLIRILTADSQSNIKVFNLIENFFSIFKKMIIGSKVIFFGS